MVLLLLSTIDGNVLVGAGFLALIFWAIWLFTSLLAWLKTHWSKILFLVQIGTFLSDCFLWWILAFLHFQLFVYKFNCLLSCLFTMSAVCLQCQLFAYKFSFWFRISAFCLQWFLKKMYFLSQCVALYCAATNTTASIARRIFSSYCTNVRKDLKKGQS